MHQIAAELKSCFHGARLRTFSSVFCVLFSTRGSASKEGVPPPRKYHNTVHVEPRQLTVKRMLPGEEASAMVGKIHMAAAEPRYIPEVVSEVAIARSLDGIHSERMVCTDGITTPCNRPITTRAEMIVL